MSYFERNFSIENDTLNGVFDMDSFNEEVSASTIVPGVHHINALGDAVTVFFKADLSASEDITFDSLVAAHEGISAEPGAQIVSFGSETAAGTPKFAMVKPDGTSKTYISHNLSTDGSPWLFNNLGVPTKVYKAEVQFTLDVVEQFNTDPNKKMILDIMAGGAPVLSEQKIFNTIFDVYDLGNKHYYTPDGGAASMGGGIVTVVFDYTDAILLDPALGMGIRFEMENGVLMGGTYCSVSLVAGPS